MLVVAILAQSLENTNYGWLQWLAQKDCDWDRLNSRSYIFFSSFLRSRFIMHGKLPHWTPRPRIKEVFTTTVAAKFSAMGPIFSHSLHLLFLLGTPRNSCNFFYAICAASFYLLFSSAFPLSAPYRAMRGGGRLLSTVDECAEPEASSYHLSFSAFLLLFGFLLFFLV